MKRQDKPKESWAQQHYNRAMAAGLSHAEYVVTNDIDDDREYCRELRNNYKRKTGKEPAP